MKRSVKSTCPYLSRAIALLEESAADEEVEGHLAGCTACQAAILEAAGSLELPSALLSAEEPPASLLDRLREVTPLGRRHPPGFRPSIPGLEVLEEIGRGGSAVVFRARQIELNRIVALKVLHPEYAAQPDGLARARRGVEALATLVHPGIVRVFQAGVHEGIYYVAEEFIDGGSLSRRLNGHPWKANEAARLVMLLADAVQALHECGFLHRDLKPGNVLLCRRASGPLAPDAAQPFYQEVVPILVDFGLVRAVDERDELTTSGIVLGTPAAMAPEQAEGKREIGPAVDIWALGVILYELLTARAPFDGESTTEVLQRVVHQAPPPPTRIAPGVPPDLEYICLTCLHKDPRARYPSAARMRDDLAAFLVGEPLPSRTSSWRNKLVRGWRRHGPTVLIGAISLLLLAVFLAWRHSEAARRESERELYHYRLEMARKHLERGDRAAAALVLDSCLPTLRDESWRELWLRCQPRDP